MIYFNCLVRNCVYYRKNDEMLSIKKKNRKPTISAMKTMAAIDSKSSMSISSDATPTNTPRKNIITIIITIPRTSIVL